MKKNDSNEPLTKGEFRVHKRDFDALKKDFNVVKKDVGILKRDVYFLKQDVRDIQERMVTRDDWDKHMVLMDALVTEMEANREERILFGKQHLRTDDMVQNHEKRICVLEKADA